MPRKRLSKPVTLVLDDKTVNMLVAYWSIKLDVAAKIDQYSVMEQYGAIHTLSEGEEAIGKAVADAFRAQFPASKFVMPKIRSKAEFDETGALKPQKKRKRR